MPYADDRASAAVLDDRRLGKQRVETLQILRALTWHSYGWRNHPAVRMWRGFVPALVSYGLAVCDEWVARGRADAVRDVLLQFTGGEEPDPARLHDRGQRPPWLGLEPLHLSHRSALVRKDAEHYRPHFPDVPDDLPYLWPPAAYPRWPVRRARAEPLPTALALELLGIDDIPPEHHEALRDLLDGLPATVQAPQTEQLTATGLVAGLTTPGSTVWLVPGPEPTVPGPPPARRAENRPGSAVSPSIARAPQPEDLASVAAEVAAAADEPEFRFLRVEQLAAAGPPRGVGLVVVDPGVAEPVAALDGLAVPVLSLRVV